MAGNYVGKVLKVAKRAAINPATWLRATSSIVMERLTEFLSTTPPRWLKTVWEIFGSVRMLFADGNRAHRAFILKRNSGIHLDLRA